MKKYLPAIKKNSELAFSKVNALMDAVNKILSKGLIAKTTERALIRDDFPPIYFEGIHILRLRGEIGHGKDGSGPGQYFDGALHLALCDDIYFIGDLIQKTEKELLSVLRLPPDPAFFLVNNIKWELAELDLELGTVIENWPPIDHLPK